MSEPVSTLESLTASFQVMGVKILEYLPRVAAAVLVLIVGWILARILRTVTIRTIGRLDRLWQRMIANRGIEHIQPRHPPARIVGELIFWLLLLVVITLATEILGLDIFGVWLKEIVTYFPLVIAGLLIVLAGFVVSSLARDIVSSSVASAGLEHGDLLGRAIQAIILFTAVIIGADQIGIDITFISVIAGIMLAAMMGGLALAFGLGAKEHVSNIIAANQLRKIYQVGDKIKIDNIEGRIMEIMVSRVMIDTESGSVDVPARLFDQQATMIIEKGE